jgi:PadR family transcriptional regulator
MPRETGLPPGTLMMLVLRVLKTQPLHGYAIAQHIHQLSADELSVEEGPAQLRGTLHVRVRYRA